MNPAPQRSADGPSIPVGGPSSFQPELPSIQNIMDALFDLHERGVTFMMLGTAWAYLDYQASHYGE